MARVARTGLSPSRGVALPRRRRGGRVSQLPLHLMLLPGVLLALVYHYGPMAGIVIAFQDFHPAQGFFGSPWVGLANFQYVFTLPQTRQILFNTVYISALKIVAGLIVPLTVALLLNELGQELVKRGVQTLIYLPHFLSWVILGGILIDILSPSSGIVNSALKFFGGHPVYFLGDTHWFPYTLVISNTWKEFGFDTIIYLAALTAIDPALYEAAMVDGAGRWRQTWHVTLPGIRPIIVLLATLSLGQILNAGFEQILVLYSPQVYATGDVIDTFVYRMGLVNAQYSIAAAFGLFKSAVSLVLISVTYFLANRYAGYRIF
jgi:putative aldouronate transport system permease protein